jgi:hypothetical protein
MWGLLRTCTIFTFLLLLIVHVYFHFCTHQTQLLAGEHELSNTCATCVCLMMNAQQVHVYLTHVHYAILVVSKPVDTQLYSLAFH